MSLVQEPPTIAEDASTPTAGLASYLFTAEVFGRMIDAEVFAAEDRVELWDGRIYEKMVKTQAHAASGINVTMTLVPVLPPGWCLSGENPVALGPKSTPLPDFAVLRGRGGSYIIRRPSPGDVGLLVELSLTSLRADVGSKLAAYAAANIAVYWVLNLVENVILVFERPIPAERRYESAQSFAVGQAVPFRLDGVLIAEIPVVELLPIEG